MIDKATKILPCVSVTVGEEIHQAGKEVGLCEENNKQAVSHVRKIPSFCVFTRQQSHGVTVL